MTGTAEVSHAYLPNEADIKLSKEIDRAPNHRRGYQRGCVRVRKLNKNDTSNINEVKTDDQYQNNLPIGPEPGAFWSGLRCLRKTPLTSYPSPHVEPVDPDFVKEFGHQHDVLHRASMKPIGGKWDARACERIVNKRKSDMSNAGKANDQDEILPRGPEAVEESDVKVSKEFARAPNHRRGYQRGCVWVRKINKDTSNEVEADDQYEKNLPRGPEPGAFWSGLRSLRKTPLTTYPSPHVEEDVDPQFVKEFAHELDILHRASMRPIRGKWNRRACVRIRKLKSDVSTVVNADDKDEILPRGPKPGDFWSGLSCLRKTPLTLYPNQHVEEDVDPAFVNEFAQELDVLHQASMKPIPGKWDRGACLRTKIVTSDLSNAVKVDDQDEILPRGPEVYEEENDESMELCHYDHEQIDRIHRMTI